MPPVPLCTPGTQDLDANVAGGRQGKTRSVPVCRCCRSVCASSLQKRYARNAAPSYGLLCVQPADRPTQHAQHAALRCVLCATQSSPPPPSFVASWVVCTVWMAPKASDPVSLWGHMHKHIHEVCGAPIKRSLTSLAPPPGPCPPHDPTHHGLLLLPQWRVLKAARIITRVASASYHCLIMPRPIRLGRALGLGTCPL